MLKIFTINRNRFGVILISLFSFFLIFAGLYSIFFQNPAIDNSSERYKTLLREEQIDLIVKIGIKNRLGQFEFEKVKDSLGNYQNDWEMTSPRELPASEEILSKIFKVLKEIRIRKAYNLGEVDASSYSLDNPVVTLSLKESTGEELTIYVGLTNPIDNSSYIQMAEEKTIFHIDSFDRSIEGLDIISLIETRPFFHEAQNVDTIITFLNDGKKRTRKFGQVNNHWINKADNSDADKTIEKLKLLKATALLDQITDSKNLITKSFNSPLIKINFLDSSTQKEAEFEVTGAIYQNIPELKMDLKHFHLAKIKKASSNEARELYFVLSKEIISELRSLIQ